MALFGASCVWLLVPPSSPSNVSGRAWPCLSFELRFPSGCLALRASPMCSNGRCSRFFMLQCGGRQRCRAAQTSFGVSNRPPLSKSTDKLTESFCWILFLYLSFTFGSGMNALTLADWILGSFCEPCSTCWGRALNELTPN